MLGVEIAMLLHTAGEYIIVAFLTTIIWVASSANTHRHYKATLLDHADTEAQSTIARQSATIKAQKKQLESLSRQLEKEHNALRAIDELLRQAYKVHASAVPPAKEQ